MPQAPGRAQRFTGWFEPTGARKRRNKTSEPPYKPPPALARGGRQRGTGRSPAKESPTSAPKADPTNRTSPNRPIP